MDAVCYRLLPCCLPILPLTATLVDFVQNSLVPSAIARWEALLNVVAAAGGVDAGTLTSLPLGNDDPISIPAHSTWPSSDMVVFVTAVQTSSCGTPGSGVLAYAASVLRDQVR